ncbi:hypothetical protein GCM10010289_85580 [Streptomyces violascens]|nr:hypothetical protein GCM10010289_85580 [Streptomyces violascens]
MKRHGTGGPTAAGARTNDAIRTENLHSAFTTPAHIGGNGQKKCPNHRPSCGAYRSPALVARQEVGPWPPLSGHRVVGPAGSLADAQWARIEPLLPKWGGRWRDHRQVIDAIAWKFRTGSPWVHLPAQHGSWEGVYTRLRNWAIDGTWERVFTRLGSSCCVPDSARAR